MKVSMVRADTFLLVKTQGCWQVSLAMKLVQSLEWPLPFRSSLQFQKREISGEVNEGGASPKRGVVLLSLFICDPNPPQTKSGGFFTGNPVRRLQRNAPKSAGFRLGYDAVL